MKVIVIRLYLNRDVSMPRCAFAACIGKNLALVTKKYKGQPQEVIDAVIVAFENCHFGKSSRIQKPYKEFRKLRLVSTSVMFRSILNGVFRDGEQNGYQLMFGGWKDFWYAVAVWVLGKTHYFHSEADVIHVRNNLSVCYFEEGIRAKILLGGKRNKSDFDNECRVVSEITRRCPQVKVPKMQIPLDQVGVTYFCDELVVNSGRRVTGRWTDDRPVITEMFAELVKIYCCMGLETIVLRDTKPKIYDQVVKGSASLKVPSTMSIDHLKNLFGKKMIVSQTHGDFSIGNVITSQSGVVIVDWELSKRHIIADDFRKTLKTYPESKNFLTECFEQLIQHAGLKCPSQWATFEEQLLLNEFMSENNILLEG